MNKNSRKDPDNRKNAFTLAMLTIVCICMIILGVAEAFPVSAVRNGAGVILTPLQSGIGRAGSWLVSRHQDARTIKELSEENETLKNKVSYLEEENTRLSENADELKKLQDLYRLDGDYASFDKIAARVVSKDPTRWYDLFTINRGSNDGIKTGMNVIADGGLAGIVTEVGTTWARVRSIIDDDSRISASLLDSDETCIVSGSLDLISEGKLGLSELKADATASSGERVVTSDISDRYLPGILIGYIDSVEEDTNNLTKNGTIIPAVDFENIKDVFVILSEKDTGNASDGSGTPESSASPESVKSSSGDTAAGSEGE